MHVYSVPLAANSRELHYAMRLAKTEAGPYAWGVSCPGMVTNSNLSLVAPVLDLMMALLKRNFV